EEESPTEPGHFLFDPGQHLTAQATAVMRPLDGDPPQFPGLVGHRGWGKVDEADWLAILIPGVRLMTVLRVRGVVVIENFLKCLDLMGLEDTRPLGNCEERRRIVGG